MIALRPPIELSPPTLPGGVVWREQDRGQDWLDVACAFAKAWSTRPRIFADERATFTLAGSRGFFAATRNGEFWDVIEYHAGGVPAWIKRGEE